MSVPSYHIRSDRPTGGVVVFSRHTLPPHDVFGRIEFDGTAKMREVAQSMIEVADAMDMVAKIPREELLAGIAPKETD